MRIVGSLEGTMNEALNGRRVEVISVHKDKIRPESHQERMYRSMPLFEQENDMPLFNRSIFIHTPL